MIVNSTRVRVCDTANKPKEKNVCSYFLVVVINTSIQYFDHFQRIHTFFLVRSNVICTPFSFFLQFSLLCVRPCISLPLFMIALLSAKSLPHNSLDYFILRCCRNDCASAVDSVLSGNSCTPRQMLHTGRCAVTPSSSFLPRHTTAAFNASMKVLSAGCHLPWFEPFVTVRSISFKKRHFRG